MIKTVLFAAAIMIATPGSLFSQDIFFSFSNTERLDALTVDVGTSGSAYIFSNEGFDFDAADINFTSSDGAVGQLTGGEAFNTLYRGFISAYRFNEADVTVASDTAGNYFAVSVNEAGIRRALSTVDDDFVFGVGFLLGRVNYNAVAEGDSVFDLALGTQGAILLGQFGIPTDVILNPTFGSATLTVAVPEPSSPVLLILGSVGLVARRRKA